MQHLNKSAYFICITIKQQLSVFNNQNTKCRGFSATVHAGQG
jgi:hypothetical protein